MHQVLGGITSTTSSLQLLGATRHQDTNWLYVALADSGCLSMTLADFYWPWLALTDSNWLLITDSNWL